MSLDLSLPGDPPFTLIRVEGALAPVLLPGAGATLGDYLARLREEGVFADAGGDLDALAGRPSAPEPPPADWLTRGALDPLIPCLQAALVKLAALDADLGVPSPGAIDGDFGERTEASVRAFQSARGLTVDGIAGPETLGALTAALAAHGVTAIPLRGADLPRVGVIIAHPRMLVPGADGVVDLVLGQVIRMGCRPVLLPPCADVLTGGADRETGLRAAVRAIDGLLGPGGDDVDPALYGEDNQSSYHTNYRRDRYEADVALTALGGAVFCFGICRSHQLWNAADGGSLVQDVVAEGLSHLSQNQGDYGIRGEEPLVVRRPDGSIAFENRVELDEASELRAVVGVPSLLTNSYHHQAVDVPGRGFKVVGTVWDDVVKRKTIEATERWNAFTTQFHPEGMQGDPLEHKMFGALGRRAYVLRLLKLAGGDLGALRRRMAELPPPFFEPSDHAWVDEDLAPQL